MAVLSNQTGGGATAASSGRRAGRWLARTASVAVLAVVAAMVSFVAGAAPAQAVPAAVSASRNVADFPRWYADQNGVRVEPCLDPNDAHCVVLANLPIYDTAQPTVWPTNYPDEWFYTIADSDVLNTPGCGGTKPGKALVRMAVEGTFLGGVPVPGDQMVFGRTRFTISSGLCPSSTYTLTYPYGTTTIQTDVDGGVARNQATTDIGCAAAPCDFTAALASPVFRSFLRWDPAVAPAADPGYLGGDAGTLHPVVGASGPGSANLFRITGPGLPPAGLSTNLFTVSGKIAGPLHAAPESADFGNQPVNVASAGRVVTLTNVSGAPLPLGAVSVTPAGGPWTIAPGSTCTGTLAADASCTVTLTFAPTAVQDYTGTLDIAHGAFRSPTRIPLKGSGTTAVAPSVTSAPAALDFRRVLVGTTSAAQGVVVHNNGPGVYVVDGVTVADDTASGGFAGDSATYLPITANTCPPAGVNPGQECTVSVDFDPTNQRPTAAELRIAGHVGATGVPLTAGLSGRGGIAQTSAGLDGLGPDGLGADGFPTWFQDDRGVRLQQCFVNDPTRCVLLAEPGFDPAAPIAFTANYPSEAFYYIADSDQMTTPGCGASPAGRAGFRAAVEQTFVNGAPVAGEQMAFDRVRVNVTSGLCAGRVYTFVHPYGEFTFTADVDGGLPRSPGTTDIGCAPTPTAACNWNLVSAGPISDGFVRWPSNDPGIPAGGYLGDAGVLHTVVGAPYVKPGSSTPQNQVEIIDTTDGSVVASTNLFTVAGRIHPSQPVTRYQSVTPSALAFGDQDVATTSAAKTVTVSSVGTAGLTVNAPAVTGANAGDFAVTANTCAAQPVGTECTVTVTFRPNGPGPRTATLTVPSDAVSTWTSAVPLTGTGIGAAVPGISVAPASLAFGDRLTDATGTGRSVTVTNTGDAPLHVSGLTLDGTDAGQFTAVGCTAAVAPGGTCLVDVLFTPTSDGAKTATLTVASDAPGTAPVVDLTGTGITPRVAVTPTTLAFGDQATGTTSAARTVTVSNPGTAPLTVSGLTVTGANASEFAATGCTAVVAPGGSCTVSVTFAPGATGARTASLQVVSDAATAAPAVALTGTGVQPALSLSATSAAFGDVRVGTTAPAQTVTVTNTGTGPLSVTGVSLGGTDPTEFTASGCVAAVAPGGTCSIVLTFTPGATGARSATVTVASNAGPATIALTGTGVAPAVSVSTTSVAFGNRLVGTTSAPVTVTVSNPGTAPLTVSGVTVTGTNAADFAASGCAAAVPAGGACAVTVTFTPSATGGRVGTLTVATDATPSAVAVALSGTGTAPGATLSATALTFGTQLVGSTSPAQTVTVTNSGSAPLTVTGVTVTGTNAADFAQTNTCAATVAPGGTCTVSVTFAPAAAGARGATLTVATDAGPRPVSLSGTGSTASAALAPTSLTFAAQTVNTTSAAQTVTVTNTGTASLTVSGVTVTGTNATEFTQTNTCAAAVPAGGTCTVSVSFRPTAAGLRTGTLSVATSAGTQTAPLSGTGSAPVVAVSPTTLAFGTWASLTTSAPLTVTVTNPGTAPLTVSAVGVTGTNAADFTQTNTCTTATVPAGGSCVVTVRFRPGAAGARTGTLTVTTTAGSPTVAMTGTGGGTNAYTVNPTTVPAFAATPVGSTSAVTNLTVTDTGTAQLSVSTVTVTGLNPADFVVTNGCTAAIAPAGTCTIGVAFRPTATGARSATLTVTSSAGVATTRALSGTGAAVPAAPTVSSVAQGAGSLTPTWTVPANGGAAITGYEVRVVSGGVQVGALRPTGAVTSLQVTGLTPGTQYQFQVRALNIAGAGPFSALSALTVVPTPPAAPVIGTAQNGFFIILLNFTTEATANWTAPTSTGGAPITGYVVHALRMSSTAANATVLSDTAVNASSAVRTLTVNGLVFGATYRFQVEAVNVAGTSARSAQSNAVTAQ